MLVKFYFISGWYRSGLYVSLTDYQLISKIPLIHVRRKTTAGLFVLKIRPGGGTIRDMAGHRFKARSADFCFFIHPTSNFDSNFNFNFNFNLNFNHSKH